MYFPLKKWCWLGSLTKWIDCTYCSNCIRNFSIWIAFPKCNMSFRNLQVHLSKIQSRSLLEQKQFPMEKQQKMQDVSEKHLLDLAKLLKHPIFQYYKAILKLICCHLYLHFTCHMMFGYQCNVACTLIEGLYHPKS